MRVALAGVYGFYLTFSLLISRPAYAIFEVEKRFLQAQGIFSASTRVLFLTAPINVILNYILVWHPKIGFGFLGAPTAVCITYWLQVVLLTLYIAYVNGKQAWCGFSKRAFINWGLMIKLAIPGVIMWAAFEVLALAAAFISSNALAAQSILGTTASILFQTPFAVAVAVSTRIGNLLGAGLVKPAKMAANVAIVMALILGLFTWAGLFLFRHNLGKLFTGDAKVVALVASVLPLSAVFEILDCFSAVAGGILRGTGKQKIGGYIVAYYLLAMPVGLSLTFKLHWDLLGLWTGMLHALTLVVVVEMIVIFRTDWQRQADEATERMEHA
ncbi:putative transporter [Neolecta irregularis DAH-3]|uniref:Putative transporter n=1 Tax=Neolecta irregularis (strain DAH-3) TaxID=1198029 RepID=A0A1U7LP34_NEOID|nr:putative transporter [Neolecta irregularis DAH-3]|eukprot:OLL24415.1 putative transporter [Neolecta irregularis DAH-3]